VDRTLNVNPKPGLNAKRIISIISNTLLSKSKRKLIQEPMKNNTYKLNPNLVSGFTDASPTKPKLIRGFGQKALQQRELSRTTNTRIVVFGTNLVSSVGNGRFNKQVSDMIELAPYQYSVVIGLLLSDGWVIPSRSARTNARLGFKQSLDHFDYTWFVFNHLSHYCSSGPQLTSGIRAGNRFYGLQFLTRSLPCFTGEAPSFSLLS
jgi:hypothetical protein